MDAKEQQAFMEKIAKDVGRGLATNEEAKAAVLAIIGERLGKMENAAKEAKTAAEEAKKLADSLHKENEMLRKQMKNMLSSNFAALKDVDGNYKGVWGDLQTCKTFGMYVISEIHYDPAARKAARKALSDMGVERKAMVDGEVKELAADDLDTGGALVPSVMIPRLVTLIESFSTFRQLAQEFPLGSGDNSIPSQTGDLTVYCPGAGVAATASTLTFGQLALNPLEWVAYCAVNRDLDEDAAIAVGELVGRSLARAFGLQEDKCGYIGDGTATYFNILGAASRLRAVDATIGNCKGLRVQDTAGVWSAIDIDDLLGTAGLLPSYAETGEEAWVANKNFYLTVMVKAALGMGGSIAADVLQTGYTRSPMFLQRPVKFGGGMPAVKPAVDHCPLLYGNFKLGAALGDRRKLTIETSREALFTQRQIAIMGTERIAINVHGVGNTTAAGPIVGFWADIA